MDNVTQQEREDGARAKLYRLSNGFGFVWRMPLHLVATRLNRRLYCFGFTCVYSPCKVVTTNVYEGKFGREEVQVKCTCLQGSLGEGVQEGYGRITSAS
jgi:hypothetical protein